MEKSRAQKWRAVAQIMNEDKKSGVKRSGKHAPNNRGLSRSFQNDDKKSGVKLFPPTPPKKATPLSKKFLCASGACGKNKKFLFEMLGSS